MEDVVYLCLFAFPIYVYVLSSLLTRGPSPNSYQGVVNVSLEDGEYLECGCCFSPAHFRNMIQCMDGHLFCSECVVSYASNLLGERNFKIVCIDQSGCKLPFPEFELKRSLTPDLLTLYERVKQAMEIEMAGLDGLEECPYCDFKMIMEGPNGTVFRCQNEKCGAVTCLECKEPDHRPKLCAVMKKKKFDDYHIVEEAMTNALVRSCPTCKRPFIKESGCNRMRCTHCMTVSCYVCRQAITGNNHFYRNPGDCVLYDDVKERHEKDVKAAERRAMVDYLKKHPERNEDTEGDATVSMRNRDESFREAGSVSVTRG